ncbi:MAG: PQQ-dependent sugar dehydrogenase [Candidatus Polarisedimenticolia bacterium]
MAKRARHVLVILTCLLLSPVFAVVPLQADCTGVAPVPEAALSMVMVADGLSGRPLYLASPPGDRDRLFIVEQDGFIRIKKRGEPVGLTHLFLDLSGIVQADRNLGEMGLLGLAFDPGYATNGFFYVNYTEGPLGSPWFTVVARYHVSGNPDAADPGSETRLLRFGQPESNHNGGHLMFGPDGYLYIFTGDGGAGGDPHGMCGNGQNTATLLGKLLRVDVRGVAPTPLPPDCGGASAAYTVPADNPLTDGPGGSCDEIWDYGLRNPWRSSFDALTGDLYIGDVGQSCWEEVNYVAAPGGGRNYGWRQMEGNHCYDIADLTCDPAGVTCGTSPVCHDPSLTEPVVEFSHAIGCSVIGGYVYRGCQLPAIAGTYFYGDLCPGFVKSFRMVEGAVTEHLDRTVELGTTPILMGSLTSFGVDDDGEIYMTDWDGAVLRIVPPFTNLEVSGAGAGTLFEMSPGSWTWENLAFTTMHPVSSYRVYRGQPGGTFTCVFAGSTAQWPGGDPSVPAPGTMHAYIVTAVNPSGQMTRSGRPPHTLSVAACP